MLAYFSRVGPPWAEAGEAKGCIMEGVWLTRFAIPIGDALSEAGGAMVICVYEEDVGSKLLV
jgi:hypothetical protein